MNQNTRGTTSPLVNGDLLNSSDATQKFSCHARAGGHP
jgi:hypothetical protein